MRRQHGGLKETSYKASNLLYVSKARSSILERKFSLLAAVSDLSKPFSWGFCRLISKSALRGHAIILVRCFPVPEVHK